MKRRPPRVTIAALQSARVRAAAALAGAVLALSGCQVMSPIQTDVPYQSADGVSVDLGNVHIRDLVVIAAAKGGPGILSGLVLNGGTRPVTVTFATASGGVARVTVPAGTPTHLSGVEGVKPVTLPGISASPGDDLTVRVGTPAGGTVDVPVPVLLPTGYYVSITPPPVPVTTQAPAPTTVPAPVPSTTPAPTSTTAQSTVPAPTSTTTP